METSTDIRLDRLTSEVSQLRYEIKQLLDQTPKPGPRYVSTKDFGIVIGKSGKTICQWLNAGLFPQSVYKKKRRGSSFIYMLDREPALRIAERLSIT